MSVCIAGHSQSEENRQSEVYRSKYMLAGYLLRAGAVCQDGSKGEITAALDLLATDELKTVSKAFPSAAKHWTAEGAATFNTKVMQEGVKSACASAELDRKRLGDVPQPAAPAADAARESALGEVRRVDRYFWIAFTASICQLRSEVWFSAISNSWKAWSDQKIHETGVTYKQANDLSQRVRGEVEQEFGPFPAVCKTLWNHPILTKLDALERDATGNYH